MLTFLYCVLSVMFAQLAERPDALWYGFPNLIFSVVFLWFAIEFAVMRRLK